MMRAVLPGRCRGGAAAERDVNPTPKVHILYVAVYGTVGRSTVLEHQKNCKGRELRMAAIFFIKLSEFNLF